MRLRALEQEFLHVPRAGRAALGAQAAVQADVLVLRHHPAGRERAGDIEVLREVDRRRAQPRAQVGLVAIAREGDAVHRADVDAGVAFDAQLVAEHRLHVAVEAAPRLGECQLRIESQLDLDTDALQRDLGVLERNAEAAVVRDRIVVAPLVDTHLLRDEARVRRRASRDVLAAALQVDRDRRLVPVRDRPDDVLRAERRIASEVHAGAGRRHRRLVDHRHSVPVELDAEVALDPRKGIFLPDRDQHVVAGNVHGRLARRHELAPAVRVDSRRDLVERDAGELALGVREFLRHEEIVDRDPLVHRVFLLPRRRLHLVEAGANDDLDAFAAQPARAPAAIHRGVAAAQHDDALADPRDVPERDAREPVEPDMDVRRRFAAAGDVEIAAARRAAADEHRVPALGEQCLEAVDALAGAKLDAEVEHIADFLVDDRLGQAEARNLAADHSAGARVAVEQHAFIAERRKIASDRQRRGAGADEGDALAIALRGARRQPVADVFLVVGGDAFQPADRHRLGLRLLVAALLHAAAAARGLAGAVAGAAEDAREDVGLPVDEVGVAVAACRDQADVLGDRRVGRTRPLAIDDLVEVIGLSDIRRLQTNLSCGGNWSSPIARARELKQVSRPDLHTLPRMLRLGRPREKACCHRGQFAARLRARPQQATIFRARSRNVRCSNDIVQRFGSNFVKAMYAFCRAAPPVAHRIAAVACLGKPLRQ